MKSQNLVFNNTYQIVSTLGAGLTAQVYLASNIYNSQEKIALKIFKHDYLHIGQHKASEAI